MSQATLEREEISYEDVEIAVRATARGRWFLQEFEARNRQADTLRILEELRRLQAASDDVRVELLRNELKELSEAIATTRQEIAAIRPKGDAPGADRIVAATGELDAIVSATERATSDILNAAENLMALAAQLRAGPAAAEADRVEEQATNILMACSFQDITGQRTGKVVNTLRYLEQRVNAMVQIWGSKTGGTGLDSDRYNPLDERPDAHLLHGPQKDGEGVSQESVDDLFASVSNDCGEINVTPIRAAPAPASPKTPAPAKGAAMAPAAISIGQDEIDNLFK